MKVKLTKELCSRCVYGAREKAEGCSYMAETGKSRLRNEKGERCDPSYCYKFVEGNKGQSSNWKKRGMGNYKI